jgi:transposase-like protein
MDLSWLDDPPPFDKYELSAEAREGLSVAHTIRAYYAGHAPQAIRDLADSYNCHPSTIRRWIRKAQREITQPPRRCQAQQCDAPLPRASRSTRCYCDAHAAPKARVRRHRKTAATNGK